VITPEVSDDALSYYNFEWLASGTRSVGRKLPGLETPIVKIPIATDDHPMHTGRIEWPGWRAALLESATQSPFFAFGLHDCYARHWLDGYADLIEQLGRLGSLVTADELCDLTFRQQG
jgi:hypothetical protein